MASVGAVHVLFDAMQGPVEWTERKIPVGRRRHVLVRHGHLHFGVETELSKPAVGRELYSENPLVKG